jgi:dolichyl-phosphate beta-glucosyltransferase
MRKITAPAWRPSGSVDMDHGVGTAELVLSVSQFNRTTSQSMVSLAPAGVPSIVAEEPYIPAVMQRAPCHLEIVIPARNEARRLPHTLRQTIQYLEAQPYSSSIVVVDNGSVDQTSDLVARRWSDRVSVQLVGCAQPGKGAAVRRGFLTSRAHFIGFMDADLATPIETLDIVMPLLDEFQVVIGSRHISGAAFAKRQPVHRAVSGVMFRTIAQRVLPGFTDTQCGFKFFHGTVARTAVRHLRIDGFAFDVELLRALTGMGAPIKEIPVLWSDQDGSTLRSLRDGARAAADVLRMAHRGSA